MAHFNTATMSVTGHERAVHVATTLLWDKVNFSHEYDPNTNQYKFTTAVNDTHYLHRAVTDSYDAYPERK